MERVGSVIPSRSAFFVIAALALAAVLPELIWGSSYSFSLRYNLVWGDQVAEAMRRGDLYPRWLPGSWDGMGSPTFYFYSPLFFLAQGALAAVSGSWISAELATTLTSMAGLIAAALSMRWWLLGFATPRAASIGAIAYMLAPYHLHNLYVRGSLAEGATAALLPLLLVAMEMVARTRGRAVVMLAIVYAGLILTHLGAALLTSVYLIPAYGLWLCWRTGEDRWRVFVGLAAGIIVGVMLSAVFLLPAISLLPHISADLLFNSYYSPQNWFFFSGANAFGSGKIADHFMATSLLATGYAMIAAAACWLGRGDGRTSLCAWIGLLCFAGISGLLPFLWKLPFVSQVQFPSRLLPIAELMAIAVLASPAIRWRPLPVTLAALPVLLGAALIVQMASFRMLQTMREGSFARQVIFAQNREGAEFLPPRYPIGFDAENRADPARTPVPDLPPVRATEGSARISDVVSKPDGALSFKIASDKPTVVEVGRFFFPHWRVRADAGSEPRLFAGSQKQVAWIAPAGVHNYRLEPGWAPFEREGWFISLVGFALLLLTRLMRRGGCRA